MTSAEFANKEGKQSEDAPKEEPKEEKTGNPAHAKSDIGESEESDDEEKQGEGEEGEESNEEEQEDDNETPEDDGARLTSEPSNLKMFFISPFEKNTEEEQ